MKSHQEGSWTDRINIGGKPGGGKVKGGIEPLGVEAFKHRTKEGDGLYCYRSRRRGDDEVILEKMPIIRPHGHTITMAYHGVGGNTYEANMTWGKAIQLNYVTQKQLVQELARVREEMGTAYSSDSYPEEVKALGRHGVNRKEYAGRIMTFRNMGMTYAQISCLVGISAGMVRETYIEEAKQSAW